ncbi:MAG: hypothetical protein FRX49_04784 [Trebouxia sp. A1-2]|nr:MAG: hypothetical protein FRX49_04784 [Trebouxia sp. A1-2]
MTDALGQNSSDLQVGSRLDAGELVGQRVHGGAVLQQLVQHKVQQGGLAATLACKATLACHQQLVDNCHNVQCDGERWAGLGSGERIGGDQRGGGKGVEGDRGKGNWRRGLNRMGAGLQGDEGKRHKDASRPSTIVWTLAHEARVWTEEAQVVYPVDVGYKLAGEDEAVNALLEARDVHDLQEVALHSAQLLGVTQALVLGVQADVLALGVIRHSPG